MLRELEAEPSQAMLEINSRLARMYPEFDIALLPVEHMQSGSLDDYNSSKPCQKAETCVGDSECADSAVEGSLNAPVAQGRHPEVCNAASAKHTAAAQRTACIAARSNGHASGLQSADVGADAQHVQLSQQAHGEHSAGEIRMLQMQPSVQPLWAMRPSMGTTTATMLMQTQQDSLRQGALPGSCSPVV